MCCLQKQGHERSMGVWKTLLWEWEEPTDHPPYQQSWQHKTHVKGAMDDASDLESWAIFTEILVIFLKGRKKHSKIMQIKN